MRFSAMLFGVFSKKGCSEDTVQQISGAGFKLAEPCVSVEEIGCQLLIHNEDADIKTKINGVSAYEYLLEICLGKVYAQVDAGWAMHAGENPVSLLWRNKDLVKSVHYKDFEKDADGSFREVRIGDGELDVGSVFQFARAQGLIQIADQDSSDGDIIDDLKHFRESFSYLSQCRDDSVSYLNILDTVTGKVKVLQKFDKVIEAPNWVKCTNTLIFNSEGKIWSYGINTGETKEIPSGECDNCNNDHVLSPDEKYIAVSHGAIGEGFTSRIYILPIDGGEPRLITPNTPSFLHGWSPDGKHIWMNSTRSGLMQVWRMNRDGSGQTQMTDNERNNWFPHVSPDGEKVIYLSYAKDELDPGEHLPNMNVELWLMDYDGNNKKKLLSFFGGQGAINVNSWSEDSRYVAFVSYELMHQ
ncbi:PD40 domain-containing protein [Butyrivibrio sp. WCD3002]|uniref:PD40 domain-containing protein n=1 Tax=Butyrivibrio sp. WCD3002 TaxID=1280676 RepID=UPI00040F37DA|nr:PD40 domain-containing protein [Butyrivibrio sp. WCD3002]